MLPQHMLQRKVYDSDCLSPSSLAPSPAQPPFFWTISLLSHLLKIISTMPGLNTSMSAFTSFNGSLKMASSTSFIALLLTWLLTCSLRLSHHPRSSTSHPNSDSTTLEGECWRSKHYRVTCSCHPYYPICLTNLIMLHIVTLCSLTHYCLCTYPPALFLLYLLFSHN